MSPPARLTVLGVRVSPALRALLDAAGPLNSATRALLLLGAAAAGLEIDGARAEPYRLLGAEELRPGVRAALLRLAALHSQADSKMDSQGDSHSDSRVDSPRSYGNAELPLAAPERAETAAEIDPVLENLLADTLDGVGFDV